MIILFIQVCYGTTENSPVTFQSLRDDRLEKRVSTVGRAHPHVEVNKLILFLILIDCGININAIGMDVSILYFKVLLFKIAIRFLFL